MNNDLQLPTDGKGPDFESLVAIIRKASDALQNNARLVINRGVTARAWLIGYYIVEYEQRGQDRAKYGEELLKKLSQRLNDKSFGLTNLKNFRLFYLMYPEMAGPIYHYVSSSFEKSQTVSDVLQLIGDQRIEKSQTPSDFSGEHQGITISSDGFAMLTHDGQVFPVPQMLFDRLSFSHITLLLPIEDPVQRSFYAIEAMRGPWSYRELKRQIDSNYFARSGWSKKPELLARIVSNNAECTTFKDEIKHGIPRPDDLGITTNCLIIVHRCTC